MIDRTRTRSRLARRFGMASALIVSAALMASCGEIEAASAVDPLEDSARQRAMVDSISAALAGPMAEREEEAALLLEMSDLYTPLDPAQRAFMEAIRHLDGGDPDLGVATGIEWRRIRGQSLQGPSGPMTMGLQLLPREAAAAFDRMNRAMTAKLGRGLVIGSGYRSPANQLFVFVTYMSHYGYSVEKTRAHVSLPGASDHNRVERPGLDFVSESGVDLQYSDAAAFEALPESDWLAEHAWTFGFEDEGPDSTSPWHWRFVGAPAVEKGVRADRASTESRR